MANLVEVTQQALNDFNDESQGGIEAVLSQEGITTFDLEAATELAPEGGSLTVFDAPSWAAFALGVLVGKRLSSE